MAVPVPATVGGGVYAGGVVERAAAEAAIGGAEDCQGSRTCPEESNQSPPHASRTRRRSRTARRPRDSRTRRKVRTHGVAALAAVAVLASTLAGCVARAEERRYPWHTDIVATTFWVGEVFDPDAPDGSQEISAYDAHWMENYGGCDGVVVDGECRTERRTADNDYFPTQMTPLQNPFYLDLPFDDVNNPEAFAMRGDVVPWADDPGYRGHADDEAFSYLKNRWVRIVHDGRTCYGQIEDAGPGVYDDARYVFGGDDARPANTRFNGAGMDVSPALNGCLGFASLNGQQDRVDWTFVEADAVPEGPWTRLVTTSQVVR